MEQQRPGFVPDSGHSFAVQQERHALRWESHYLCLMLAGIQIIAMVLAALGRIFLRQMGLYTLSLDAFHGIPPVLYFLLNGSLLLVGITVSVFLYWGIRHISPAETLPFQPVPPGVALLMILFGVGICSVSNIPTSIVVMIQNQMGFSGQVPDLPINGDPVVQTLFFFALAVIPALAEELVFRGAILSGLRRFGDTFAIFASAFLFAIYHMNFTQMVFAFFCGLVLAFVVVKTGNLWVGIAIHFINNCASVVMTLMEYNTGEPAQSIYVVYFLATAAAGLIALLLLSMRDKGFWRLRPSYSVLRPSQKFLALILNPGAIFLLVMAFTTAVSLLVSY